MPRYEPSENSAAAPFGWAEAFAIARWGAVSLAWDLATRIAWMLARRRTRRDLAELDDRLLDDIGLTRRDANAEARKPFWMG